MHTHTRIRAHTRAHTNIHICTQALAALTGAPCETLQFSSSPDAEQDNAKGDENYGNLTITSVEELWVRMDSCQAANFLMAASCGKLDADESAYEAMGLTTRHAYRCVSVRIFSNGDLPLSSQVENFLTRPLHFQCAGRARSAAKARGVQGVCLLDRIPSYFDASPLTLGVLVAKEDPPPSLSRA